MSDQVSALDATFLELEEADESAHMHIGAVVLIEPQPAGGAPPIEVVRRDVLARLGDLPRFAERLSAARTGGLAWPSWVPDREFDISRHVKAASLPAPAGRDELLEWAGEYFSERLDRGRPLWELVVIELADGSWALVSKTHHCLVDGVGSVDISHVLLDIQPEYRPPAGSDGDRAAATDQTEPASAPGGILVRLAQPALLAARAAIGVAELGVRTAETALGVARHPHRAREALRRSRALGELIVRDELIAAPRTSLNRPMGGRRRLAVMTAELDELRAIKQSLGGTVNDVVLATATGGLRRLLLARGEDLPPQGLRAMVPVNVRNAADRLVLGNRITSLFVHLPVAADDPLRRYELQIEEAETLKAGTQALGSTTLLDVSSLLPPVLHSVVARAIYASRLFNVTITNVPGPQMPLYCIGSRVREIWPLVPLAAEHAVGLAVFSYDGRLFFCLNTDRDTVPDLDLLSEGIAASLEELRELARRATAGGDGAGTGEDADEGPEVGGPSIGRVA